MAHRGGGSEPNLLNGNAVPWDGRQPSRLMVFFGERLRPMETLLLENAPYGMRTPHLLTHLPFRCGIRDRTRGQV